MRRGRVWRGLGALTLLSVVAAGCGDDDDGETTPVEESDDGGTEAEEVEAQEISVTAVDYSYSEAPTELDAGLVTMRFENEGKVGHEAAFIEIGDTPLQEFLPKFAPVVSEEGGPIPEESVNVSSPVELRPGESTTTTFTIAEGTYALLCTFTDQDEAPELAEAPDAEVLHFNRGMAQVVTVNPGEADPELPAADATITGSDWTFDADISDGDSSFNWVNEGPAEVHFVGISEYEEGTDPAAIEEAFLASFQSEDGSPPEGSPEPSNEEFAFGGVFSAGQGQRVELDEPFESGKSYLLVCFLTDRAGGPPHAFPEEMGGHGMYEVVTVE